MGNKPATKIRANELEYFRQQTAFTEAEIRIEKFTNEIIYSTCSFLF